MENRIIFTEKVVKKVNRKIHKRFSTSTNFYVFDTVHRSILLTCTQAYFSRVLDLHTNGLQNLKENKIWLNDMEKYILTLNITFSRVVMEK